jgi:holo-[acyl-carrier protein] synthase
MPVLLASECVEVEGLEDRLECNGARMLLFSAQEWKKAKKRAHPGEGLAARLAAKKAIVDAFQAMNYPVSVPLRDLEVLNHASGKPYLKIGNKKFQKIFEANVKACHLTLSHTHHEGIAVVVLELKP